jgi:hypothetical protein
MQLRHSFRIMLRAHLFKLEISDFKVVYKHSLFYRELCKAYIFLFVWLLPFFLNQLSSFPK